MTECIAGGALRAEANVESEMDLCAWQQSASICTPLQGMQQMMKALKACMHARTNIVKASRWVALGHTFKKKRSMSSMVSSGLTA